ncbi:MAG TPA: hypothetical protein VMM76_16030 [Pirellulaceae bacterium]|nr:hypothetical protein [Pirellulaceae bacterium]
MKRTAGIHPTTTAGGEKVRAFIPQVLPPQQPPLRERIQTVHLP